MILEKVFIEGFRSYKERTEIVMSKLTTIIGENDVGKSTIIEALDAFFNDVADAQDVNVDIVDKKFTIGCVFSDLPAVINLDATTQTSLEDEYLLNSDGRLEIYKVFKATATKVDVERIYAVANAPENEMAKDLLFKKRDELKAIVEQHGLAADKRNNPEMRRSIYRFLENRGDLNLQSCEVELDRPKEKGGEFIEPRKLWTKISSRHLPVYSLFRTDNVKGDKEPAVRSPLDSTLKQALKEIEDELSPIAEAVEKKVRETTEKTLDRLKKDYPEIAQSLTPDYKKPTWSKAFDLDVLRGDDNIPLNKRGTGVRRLVVLAFFQAEAEKKRQAKAEGAVHPPVIYAIEEPETSQHPSFQKNITEAIKSLVEAGDQVIVTTHVPGLAELLPIDSIRFVDRVTGSSTPRVRSGAKNSSVLREASASLGVLPSAVPSDNAQVAVWLEGDSDVWVMERIAETLSASGLIPKELDVRRIFYIFGGGGDQLKSFVNGEYLDALGLPQFYLRDSDKEASDHPGKPLPQDVSDRVARWENDKEGTPISVRLTKKREIENYLHISAVQRALKIDEDISEKFKDVDLDFDDLSSSRSEFWRILSELKEETGKRFDEGVRRGVKIQHRKPKHVLCGLILPELSSDEIRERCASTDGAGVEISEVESWFRDMARLAQAAGR